MLEAVGLPKKDLKPICEGLCELVRERIELGQMRGKARKVKARGTRAEKQVAEDVLEELLPDGPKPFPEKFLSAAAGAGKKTCIELPKVTPNNSASSPKTRASLYPMTPTSYACASRK